MTVTTVRTYALGDAPDDYTWRPESDGWCGARDPGHGYVCSIRSGHEGPQHVAAHSSAIVGVWDRDQADDVHEHEPYTLTLLDGRRVQVPAEIYPTVRDEQHAYTVMLDELRTQVREAQARELDVQRRLDTLREREAERMEAFRQQVGQVAMRYARRHDWCGVVQQALGELGIEVKQRFRVRATMKAERDGWTAERENVYVVIESTSTEQAWRDVDALSDPDDVEVDESIPDGWEFASFDASTSDIEVVEED